MISHLHTLLRRLAKPCLTDPLNTASKPLGAGGLEIRQTCVSNLMQYFPDKPCIRVCTTESSSDDIYGFHRISYAQFCCMVDTGDVWDLTKSTANDAECPLDFFGN